MRRKLIIGLCILVVLLAGIGIYLRNGFYGNCVPERRSLYVRSGSEYRTLEDSLDAAIAHTAFFRFYARHIELDRSFKPGHYVLEPGMNSGLSRLEVMTLASIVYEETRQSDEMPRIAGVYINRLRKGWPLQADPTVKYALQEFGLRRILHRHLKYPSPYNTYINKGLPPSPICMPGRNAIDAVLDFERHDYMFFCARPTFDGYHDFARTLREHNANARAYSAELNRRKIR